MQKRYGKYDSKQPSFDDYNNKGDSLYKRQRTDDGTNDKVEKLKFAYGSAIAALLKKGVSIAQIKTGLAKGDLSLQKVIESIGSIRSELVQCRPNADAYLVHPFYIGIRVKSCPDDDKRCVVEYYNGAKSHTTYVVRTANDLSKYCTSIYNILTEKDLITELEADQRLADLEKQLDELVSDTVMEEEGENKPVA